MRTLCVTLLLVSFSIITTLTAQESKPVQFAFSSVRVNDTLAYLVVKAKIEKGLQLFSTRKLNENDAFISNVQATENPTRKILQKGWMETGNTVSITDPIEDTIVHKGFADSMEVRVPFFLIAGKDSSLQIKGTFDWLGKKGDNYPSGSENFIVQIPENTSLGESTTENDANAGKSLWSIFLLTFLTGLIAVITPCVFPLIPVTVSFFLKRSKSRAEGLRNSLWYSLSIILIYTIPTLLLTLAFGDTALYKISTHPVSNILFFVIFIVFAISFFGAFELELPNSWANKADQKAGKGGLTGIFFMALTLVIVSFSCTGPLVGTLLGQTSTGGVSASPIVGMLGFGAGLALPFSLFAFFPSMLQSLPKSGGWLNAVKVTFGFIELALAMKFLSNVDLAYHWHLLDRDVFLVIWIVIFGLMGLYLLGKLRFSHDSEMKYISVPRLFFSIFSFCFALYMIPGLWGAPLKLLSGFIPPSTTQEFNLDDLKYKFDNLSAGNTFALSGSNSAVKPPVKYIDRLHVPFGLKAYFDLEEGMAAARALKKPVMLDFTGHSCANCRKMEEQVWKNPEVLKRIKENFVLISLYVDESTELPLTEQLTNARGEKITTVGEKNLDYEITKFGFNAQPLYMFLDLKGNPLSDVKYGYDADVAKFIAHLDAVKAAFDKAVQ